MGATCTTYGWEDFSINTVDEHHTAEQRIQALAQVAESFIRCIQPTKATATKKAQPTDSPTNAIGQWLAQITTYILMCQRGGIAILERKTNALRPLGDVGLTSEERQQWWQELQRSPSSASFTSADILTLHTGDVIVRDLTAQPGRSQSPGGTRTALLVPIHIDERLVGVLGLEYHNHEQVIAPESLSLARAMAKLAALALQREDLARERVKLRATIATFQEASSKMEAALSLTCHELKTPLTAIKMSVQLAERHLQLLRHTNALTDQVYRKLTSVQELLDLMDRHVSMEDRLASDLVDMSRIQAGRMEVRPVPCDLTMIVHEAIAGQRLAWRPRIIHLDTPEGMVPVLADPDRVIQVVNNYLTNALKYSPNDQPVEVRVQLDEQQARVSVRDHGAGIPRRELKQVWERFYRVKGVQVQSGSGIGLGIGLYLCRSIIQQHQGKVGAESAPHRGSTFWFTLPLTTATPAADEVTIV